MMDGKQITVAKGRKKGGPVLRVPLVGAYLVQSTSSVLSGSLRTYYLAGATNDWSDMSAMWSEFRIRKIKVTIVPAAPSGSLTSNVSAAIVFDPMFSGTTLTANQLLSYQDVVIIPAGLAYNKGSITKTWSYPSSGGDAAIQWYSTGAPSTLPGSLMFGSISEAPTSSTSDEFTIIYNIETEFRTFGSA
jgi:hypothetical protein